MFVRMLLLKGSVCFKVYGSLVLLLVECLSVVFLCLVLSCV